MDKFPAIMIEIIASKLLRKRNQLNKFWNEYSRRWLRNFPSMKWNATEFVLEYGFYQSISYGFHLQIFLIEMMKSNGNCLVYDVFMMRYSNAFSIHRHFDLSI